MNHRTLKNVYLIQSFFYTPFIILLSVCAHAQHALPRKAEKVKVNYRMDIGKITQNAFLILKAIRRNPTFCIFYVFSNLIILACCGIMNLKFLL